MLQPEVGTVVDGKYRIVKPLGHGGFAGTFLAEDLPTKSHVCLKLPDVNQLGDPAVYERFKREVAIGRLLQHPDLSVAFASSEGSPPYLVFHFIEGDTLAELLKKVKRLPVDQAIEMASYLLDALDYCHKRGIYHRDIKPENLIVGSDGHLKVIDFGIALTVKSSRVTWRGFSGLVGTPEYMSPEQIKGERGNEKSDIYAVGCLLYHMITGFPPYSGDNPMATMYQHLTSSPKPLPQIVKDSNPAVWACIRHAMRRRKEERYSSASEMAKDLRDLSHVDLNYVDLPDPPMVAVTQSKNFNKTIGIIMGVVAALAGICLLLYLFIIK